MQDLKVIGIQSDLHWADIDANLKHFDEHLSNISEQVDLIILPEMFTTGFIMEPEQFDQADLNKGLTWMMLKAKALNTVITGSMIQIEEGQFFNRMYWVEPNGNVQHYNKRHLFRLANEQDVYTGGNERKIVELNGWRILLNICYDLRFPVWSRNQEDYDLMLYVANWPERRRTAWSALLKARAIENLSYCIGINRVGEDGNQVSHSGDSAIIHPNGEFLASDEQKESILKATLSAQELEDWRKKLPFHMDRDQFEISY